MTSSWGRGVNDSLTEGSKGGQTGGEINLLFCTVKHDKTDQIKITELTEKTIMDEGKMKSIQGILNTILSAVAENTAGK